MNLEDKHASLVREIERADSKIDQLQDALYWAWYGWNTSEISNDKITAKVNAALFGYAPYEKRKRLNATFNQSWEKCICVPGGENRDLLFLSGGDYEMSKEFNLEEVLLDAVNDYPQENGKIIHPAQIEDISNYLKRLKKVVSKIEGVLP